MTTTDEPQTGHCYRSGRFRPGHADRVAANRFAAPFCEARGEEANHSVQRLDRRPRFI